MRKWNDLCYAWEILECSSVCIFLSFNWEKNNQKKLEEVMC